MDSKNSSVKIVRALAIVTGKGTDVFNDRIQGGRSIKVWGWPRAHYELAVEAMAKQGIKARLVITPESKYEWRNGGSIRIHTQEAVQQRTRRPYSRV
jgi:hypothetical protein